ncbi:MAG: rhomboid family intramembrane serine protease [Marinilabiliales bacterium]|nr:MAG: rhomboid family intramembrane serine protease [Marinilabiliales bacterium]
MNKVILIIVVITGAITYFSWQKEELLSKLLFSPYFIKRRKEYYRFLTHGFVHANLAHVLVNMLVFWSFGSVLIQYFDIFCGNFANLLFIGFYLAAIILSSVFSFFKHKDNPYYSAVGASGGTSAIVFASIFFDPWNKVYFFGVIPIPGIIFGGLYLLYSYRMSKRGGDNIGHDAHFWGAVFGFFFPLLLKPELFQYFLNRLIRIF